MFGIGMPELILILAIALIVIGPKKLPGLAKSLGRAMGEFRKATDDLKDSITADTEFKEVKKSFDDINQDIKDSFKASPESPPNFQTDPTASTDEMPQADSTDEMPQAETETAASQDRGEPLSDLKDAFDQFNDEAKESAKGDEESQPASVRSDTDEKSEAPKQPPNIESDIESDGKSDIEK